MRGKWSRSSNKLLIRDTSQVESYDLCYCSSISTMILWVDSGINTSGLRLLQPSEIVLSH